VPIVELNGASDDARSTVRRDGLEMFFDSNRPGTQGALDIWVTTRARTWHHVSTRTRLDDAGDDEDED
jgi:hypothetical protein